MPDLSYNSHYRNRQNFFTVFIASATSLLGLGLIFALATGFLSSSQRKTDPGQSMAAGDYRIIGRIWKDGVQQNGLVLTSSDGQYASWVNDGVGSYYYQIGRWIAGSLVTITLKNPYYDRACAWNFDNLPNQPGGESSGSGCIAKVTIGAGDYGTEWQNHLTWTLVAGPTRPPTWTPPVLPPTYTPPPWPTEPPTPTYGWITRPPTPGYSTPTLPPFPSRTRTPTRAPTLIPIFNLLQNPGFEDDANGNGRPDFWTDTAKFIRVLSTLTNPSYGGKYYGRIYSTDNTSFLISQTVPNPSKPTFPNPIVPGRTYNYSGWVKIPSFITGTGKYSAIQVRWYDVNNYLLKTDEIKRYTGATAGWVSFSGNVTAPVNSSYARVRIWNSNLNATVHIDDFSFRRL